MSGNRTTVRGWQHVRWVVRWGGRLTLDDLVPLIRAEGVPREFGPYVAQLMEPQQPGRPPSTWQEKADRWARVLRLRDAVRREHAILKAEGARQAKATAVMRVAEREFIADDTLGDLLKKGLRGAPPVVRVMDWTNEEMFALEQNARQTESNIEAVDIRRILEQADRQLAALDPGLFDEYDLSDEYELIADAADRRTWEYMPQRGCDETGHPRDPAHHWNRPGGKGG